jgi:hypothetical protein
MSDESNPLEESLDRLTREHTPESATLDDLARRTLASDADQMKGNLEVLERLAGGEDATD